MNNKSDVFLRFNFGMPVEEKNLELTPPLFPTTDNNSIANADDVLKPDQKDKQIKPDLECPSYQELYTEVIELREAVKKATKLQTAHDILRTYPKSSAAR